MTYRTISGRRRTKRRANLGRWIMTMMVVTSGQGARPQACCLSWISALPLTLIVTHESILIITMTSETPPGTLRAPVRSLPTIWEEIYDMIKEICWLLRWNWTTEAEVFLSSLTPYRESLRGSHLWHAFLPSLRHLSRPQFQETEMIIIMLRIGACRQVGG